MSVQEVRRRRGPTQTTGEEQDGGFTHIPTSNKPHPIPIVVSKGEHEFELDVEALQQLLLSEEVRERKVVVLSVAGAFRKGKSFLLDFLIRYLERMDLPRDWLGDPDEPLTGFPWRGGSERETTGILMWSQPFLSVLPTGEEVAILLMDTQGAFDNRSTVKDCATIFALSTMLASVQVFNLSQLIQENDLQHLQLFTEYGRLALESGSSGVFQSLTFLVRDWSYPYEHSFGIEGGYGYLEKTLNISDEQHKELMEVRKHINECFKSVTCFLMPYPGVKVATSPVFDGRLSDIDKKFLDSVREFAPLFLAQDNLVVKEINGTPINGRGLLELFKIYMKIFQGEDLPEPKGMLQATAEANNLAAQADSFDLYNREMEIVVGGDQPYLNEEQLNAKHQAICEKALDLFKSVKKMGGESYSKQFEDKLKEQIKEAFEHFQAQNASKNIFAAARTPAVLFSLMVILYLLSSIFYFVGLTPVSSLMNWSLGVAILALVVWSYVRFSGQQREIGQYIDSFVETIWDNVIIPGYTLALNKGMQTATGITIDKKKN